MLLCHTKLPICQICFAPLLHNHTDRYPSICMYPMSIAPLAFLLWNNLSILALVVCVLCQIVPYEDIEGELELDHYTNFWGVLAAILPSSCCSSGFIGSFTTKMVFSHCKR
ncbi:hypothetical protein J3R82DRAFT_7742 [Butyriboletus roseoflavus]|nr:hypothetical protein J3R82DRAFT_7742 [Butyriboletus roseoflavus]